MEEGWGRKLLPGAPRLRLLQQVGRRPTWGLELEASLQKSHGAQSNALIISVKETEAQRGLPSPGSHEPHAGWLSL